MNGIAFYEAAVQIIPLLLIVIAFESRFSTDRLSTRAYVVSFVVGLYIFYAELTALWVLRTGEGAEWKDHLSRDHRGTRSDPRTHIPYLQDGSG